MYFNHFCDFFAFTNFSALTMNPPTLHEQFFILRFEINLFVDSSGREDIVADAYVIGEDALKLGSLGGCT